jgi:hypothetical protein
MPARMGRRSCRLMADRPDSVRKNGNLLAA